MSDSQNRRTPQFVVRDRERPILCQAPPQVVGPVLSIAGPSGVQLVRRCCERDELAALYRSPDCASYADGMERRNVVERNHTAWEQLSNGESYVAGDRSEFVGAVDMEKAVRWW